MGAAGVLRRAPGGAGHPGGSRCCTQAEVEENLWFFGVFFSYILHDAVSFAALSFSHHQLGKGGHWSPSLRTSWPEHPLRCSRLLASARWGMISAVTLLFA